MLLDVRGVNLVLDEDVNGRYRIIDVLGAEVLLIEDNTGQAFTVGQRSTDIQAKRVAAWRGEPVANSTYRLELAGRRVSDLLLSLPKTAERVLITGELELNQSINLPPMVGGFARLEASDSTLRTRSARPTDLEVFSNSLIVEGSVVVRAYYPPDEEHVALVGHNASPFKSHVFTIPNLPSVSGLLLSMGDEILEGERIARYVDDDALELAEAEQEAAMSRLSELQAELARETERFERRRQVLEQSITAATQEVSKQHYLVREGASPRNQLDRAEQMLAEQEFNLLMLETDWTSERSKLEANLRDTNLAIAKADRTLTAELQQQWVVSPLAGLVSEIRVTAVTARGVTLDIVILEGAENLVVSN